MSSRLDKVIDDIYAEREYQDGKWGEQNPPDGTSAEKFGPSAELARVICDKSFKLGGGTWTHILLEEVYEALAEEDPTKLRTELVQVAAVAVNWIEAIDRRTHDL